MVYLKKKYVGDTFESNVEFDIISDDLLIVMVQKAIPSKGGVHGYWRLTGYETNDIPPLEIGIHYIEQSIDNITFFISKGMITGSSSIELPTVEGSVLIDNSIFSKEYDFVDIDETYNVSLQDNKLLVCWDDIDDSSKAFRNQRVEIYVNEQNCIIGFAILDLTCCELELIKKYI